MCNRIGCGDNRDTLEPAWEDHYSASDTDWRAWGYHTYHDDHDGIW